MKRTTPVIPPEDIRRQKEYCAQLRAMNAQRPAPPLAYVDTYGCQQNEADSELLRGMLCEMGYEIVPTGEGADVIVINTCAIREHAEQRVFGNVGALVHGKRRNPGQIICLCGCMAQEPHVAEKIKQSYRQVDLVFAEKRTDDDGYLSWDQENWTCVDGKRFIRSYFLEGRALSDYSGYNKYDLKGCFLPEQAKEVRLG